MGSASLVLCVDHLTRLLADCDPSSEGGDELYPEADCVVYFEPIWGLLNEDSSYLSFRTCGLRLRTTTTDTDPTGANRLLRRSLQTTRRRRERRCSSKRLHHAQLPDRRFFRCVRPAADYRGRRTRDEQCLRIGRAANLLHKPRLQRRLYYCLLLTDCR